MGIKTYGMATPGSRFRATLDFSEITKSKPEKRLTRPKRRTNGRNMSGRVTVRWRGGGHKRKYRVIDFKREKINIPAKVFSIEYDPNRTTNIALLHYADGEKRYILAPEGLKVGMQIVSGPQAEVKSGNCLPISEIPVGELLHNIELQPGRGGQIVRTAGGSAQLMAKIGKHGLVRLPSGEQRRVLLACFATVGVLGNADHINRSIGKAGANRWKGRQPSVRGVAQNPVDHPHGGGEGKTSGGRHPVTPWGKPTKGFKTRRNKRTQKFIVRSRHQ